MPRLTTAQKMQARMTPSQIVSARLLELPTVELSQAVHEELAANPALELMDASQACARCGLPAPGTLCLSCAMAHGDVASGGDVGDRDPLMTVASPRSVTDALLDDLRASIHARDHAIAEALVGNLDDHGFLVIGVGEIAVSCGVDEPRVVRVLTQLQQIGPPGVGSRDARDWLLTQIGEMTDASAPLARRIIEDHLEELAAHHDSVIASALDVSLDDIQRARTFMQEELRPFPIVASSTGAVDRNVVHYRVPDVAVHETGSIFVAEVLASSHRWLRLAPAYADLTKVVSTLGEDEQAHVREYAERARMFLRGMTNRHLTLQRVADSVVGRQQGYFRDGVRGHVSLTRLQVADELVMHVSSVSRAVSGKAVQLHTRRVIDFSELFETSSDAKKALRQLIEHEATPRTDEDLAGALGELGFAVSRRTVAKYRDEMGIVPYRARVRARAERR